MKLRALLIFIIFSFPTLVFTASMTEIAQTVLDQLYEANGNFIFKKPELRITNDELNAATYLRRANRIEISEKTMKVCQSFGADYHDAVAFIVGHELAHSYKSEMIHTQSSFLAYDKYHHSVGKKEEEEADLHGLFMAYLSGFKSMNLIEDLIDKIYSEFDLKGKVLKNYPTLKERQKSTKKVTILAEELIQLYEAGNHLLVIGEYELAAACYEHVEQFYSSKEVYNNLGVCYSLAALNISKTNSEPFVYPFEINWSLRFKKPKGQRGGNDLSQLDLLKRKDFLNKAIHFFALVLNMDSDFFEAKLNLMSAMSMQGNPADALNFYKESELSKKETWLGKSVFAKDKIRLAFALAIFDIEKIVAIRIWKDLSKSTNPTIVRHAIHNLQIAKGGTIPTISSLTDDCGDLSTLNKTIEGIKLHRPFGNFNSLARTKELEFSIITKSNSTVYYFKNKGNLAFSLQRVLKTPTTEIHHNKNGIFSGAKYLFACPDNRISIVSENGAVMEWAKYYGEGI